MPGFQDLTDWSFVYLRIIAWLSVFPLFSMANIPVRLRLALAAMVAFLITPTLPSAVEVPDGMIGVVGWMAMEIAIGLLLGFICRMIFFIVEFAGSVAAMEVGLNMAAGMNPFSSARSEVPSIMLFYLAAMLFLTLDLHHWLLYGLQRTYQILPIGGARLQEPLFHDMVLRTGQVFLYGILMAAPIVAVAFLINLVFSLLGRAVPQMNIFIESFAFRILAGLIVFGFTVNLMAQHIVNILKRLPEDMLRVSGLLNGA
jgi:flagellar biosynthetic protein FliR